MSKKVLYLECFSGISGDMTVGALLDLGADPEVLKQSLDSLHVDGYEVKIGRSSKCGIDACDFDVLIPDQPEYDEGHMHHHDDDHDHEHHHHDDDHATNIITTIMTIIIMITAMVIIMRMYIEIFMMYSQ